ncbi:hypothetical protein AN189_14960, partial [Loktanella sp. 3ANDIMAR09]
TDLAIAPTPALEVIKVISQPASAVGETVVFEITATNTGNVTLSDLAVTDTLTALDDSPRDPGPVVLIAGDSADVLAVGARNTYEVRYVLTQADVNAGGLQNLAEVTGTTPAGDVVQRVSRDDDDTDGNPEVDPTVLLVDGLSAIAVTKTASVPIRLSPTEVRYDFEIAVENTGTITQTNLQVRDDLRAFAAPARVISVSGLTASGLSGPGGIDRSYDGVDQTRTLRGDAQLEPGVTAVVAFSVVLDVSAGYPAQPNRAEVTSDTEEAAIVGSAVVTAPPPAEVRVTKVADTQTALLGATVGYTLTFTNVNRTIERGLTFVDALPAGLAYTPGSAVFDGRTESEPVIDGARLEWRNVTLGPEQTITVTLSARVTGGDGDLANTAFALDSSGAIISNRAEAVIVRRPEAVFDCGDVIGKVFDDRNLNGYQDGLVSDGTGAITDQTYDGAKFTAPPVVLPDGEPGLAGVRLSTVNGTVLTTDAYGRFSVPCAELPANIGSNFTLKLDERTLPTGYNVTTENPRTVRLTPGTVAKLNFGAAIANVVRIDLTAQAFAGGGATPVPALSDGIAAVLAQIRDVPSVLQLSYYTADEGRGLARARLDAVDDLIRSLWDGSADYSLIIERAIRAAQ